MDTALRVVIYARVSTNRQETANQVLALHQFAAARNWTITQVYTDEVSGRTGERPAFKQLFADASRRKFDLVLFWSFDRLSREGILQTLQYLKRLTGYGVAWKSYQEEFLDSQGEFKDVVISILSWVARQESLRRSERIKAGIARCKAQGQKFGPKPIVLDRVRLREMRTSGASLSAIAREFSISKSTAARLTA